MPIYSQGPYSPGTATGWTSPNNAKVSDDNYASNATDAFITLSNFGFNIPTEATSITIKGEFEAKTGSGTEGCHANAYDPGVTYENLLYYATNGVTTATEAYRTNGFVATTLTPAQINSSGFGAYFCIPYPTGNTVYLDHVRLTISYTITVTGTKTLTSTSTGSQAFTKATAVQPYTLANNNQAYVLNVNTGSWTFIDNHPFTSMIYRPLSRTVLGARRDEGDICTINSGDLFDLTSIAWSFQTGYMNFGQLDEVKEMPPSASEALKRVRALFSEVKAGGNITVTVYTENDSTGKAFTITPATTDNTVYNMVRTALSRDIRGKYVSFKFSGTVDAWIGETGLKIAARNVR